MNAITLNTTPDNYLVSIDRKLIDQPTFRAFFERLRLEMLASVMNTDNADLQQISEQIKAEWWARNEQDIMARINGQIVDK